MSGFSSHYASQTAIEGSVTSSQSFRPRSLPPYLKSVSPIALDENGYKDVGKKVVRQPWLPDHQAQGCMHPGCPTFFSITERRHHCRRCGKIFCSTHTGYQSLIDSDTSVDRVCNLCFFEQEHKQKGRNGSHSSTGGGFLHYVSRESLHEDQVIDTAPNLEPGTFASNAFIAGVEITRGLEPAYIVDVRARKNDAAEYNAYDNLLGKDDRNNNTAKVNGNSPSPTNEKRYNVWCVRRHFSDFLYLVKTMKYGIDLSNFRKSTPDLNDPHGLKSSIELLNNVLALCLRSKWRKNTTVQTFLCDSPLRRKHMIPKEVIGKQLIEKGNLLSFPLVVLRAEIVDIGKGPYVTFVICTRSVQNRKEIFHIVKRRYTYFQVLNQQLKKQFPKRSKIGKELPSLPGKSMDPIGGTRFNAGRIEKKRINLELYLHELLLIPETRVSDELKTFLGVTPVPLDSEVEDALDKPYDDLGFYSDQIKPRSQNGYNNVSETKGNHAAEIAGSIESKNTKKVAYASDDEVLNESGTTEDCDDFSATHSEVMDENDVKKNLIALGMEQERRLSEQKSGSREVSSGTRTAVETDNDHSKVKKKEKKDGTTPSNKGEDEDARKTKTAKFIAELLKRSLEAKLDLASKESEYEKLQEELKIMKTQCANERTLRLAAEKENADLRKELQMVLAKNQKYPRGQLQKYWQ